MNNNVKLFKKCKHLDKLEIKLKLYFNFSIKIRILQLLLGAVGLKQNSCN